MISSMENGDADNPQSLLLRNLPSVDFLLNQPAIATLLDEFARAELVHCIRAVLDDRREALRAGSSPALDVPALALDIRQKLYERTRPNLRRVINAAGIVLHTGLGRAPLAEEALEAITDVAAGYCNLELNLATGRRGDRHEHLRDLLRELTGAEDALVVNNNAAGTYLTLNTLAAGRPVVISRGQLVEIGGSYRMPDIMAAAGCKMVEVGTTNRTRIADYERAINEETSVLLRVHTSNYRIRGFVASPALEALVALAHKYPRQSIAVVDDLGSGLLDRPSASAAEPNEDNLEASGARFAADWDEPTVRESVAAGADLTLFSGDKLLGGPQAGVIVGRTELIARLRENPLARTFRPDKMTLAGLEATLRLYRDPQALLRRLPVFRMLGTATDHLENLANRLAQRIARQVPAAEVNCAPDESFAGGGTLPTIPFPTWVVRLRHVALDSGRVAAALRQRDVPIVCRVHDEALVFDCRTLSEGDVDEIPAALAETLRELNSE
ncbi:MAG: L-seryl-tRNA(Sec) selenium transferase [Phycisphaerae bacterium]